MVDVKKSGKCSKYVRSTEAMLALLPDGGVTTAARSGRTSLASGGGTVTVPLIAAGTIPLLVGTTTTTHSTTITTTTTHTSNDNTYKRHWLPKLHSTMNYLIMARQQCPQTKRIHLQGYCQFKKSVTLQRAEERIGCPIRPVHQGSLNDESVLNNDENRQQHNDTEKVNNDTQDNITKIIKVDNNNTDDKIVYSSRIYIAAQKMSAEQNRDYVRRGYGAMSVEKRSTNLSMLNTTLPLDALPSEEIKMALATSQGSKTLNLADYIELGQFDSGCLGTVGQGTRTDLATVQRKILSGEWDLTTVVDHVPGLYCRYRAAIDNWLTRGNDNHMDTLLWCCSWMKKPKECKAVWRLLQYVSHPCGRKLCWLWSRQGKKGKSTIMAWLANWLRVTQPDKKVFSSESDTSVNIAYQWNRQPYVFLDLARATNYDDMPWTCVESLTHGRVSSSKFHSCKKTCATGRPHIIVCSNLPPHLDKLSPDVYISLCLDDPPMEKHWETQSEAGDSRSRSPEQGSENALPLRIIDQPPQPSAPTLSLKSSTYQPQQQPTTPRLLTRLPTTQTQLFASTPGVTNTERLMQTMVTTMCTTMCNFVQDQQKKNNYNKSGYGGSNSTHQRKMAEQIHKMTEYVGQDTVTHTFSWYDGEGDVYSWRPTSPIPPLSCTPTGMKNSSPLDCNNLFTKKTQTTHPL